MQCLIIIIIISKFIKRHVCLQKAAEALVMCRSDGLVTGIKQECLKMSFKTMFRIAQKEVFLQVGRDTSRVHSTRQHRCLVEDALAYWKPVELSK